MCARVTQTGEGGDKDRQTRQNTHKTGLSGPVRGLHARSTCTGRPTQTCMTKTCLRVRAKNASCRPHNFMICMTILTNRQTEQASTQARKHHQLNHSWGHTAPGRARAADHIRMFVRGCRYTRIAGPPPDAPTGRPGGAGRSHSPVRRELKISMALRATTGPLKPKNS